MIKRLLCALAFHKVIIIESIRSVDVCECSNCKRRWAVETERQVVKEITRGRA